MTTLQTLQAAMMRDPHDLSVWLAIADALEEDGKTWQAKHARLWLAEVVPEFRLPTNPELRRAFERQRLSLPLPEHTNSIGMKFAWIPPGKFLMGTTIELDQYAYPEEMPRHEVTLTKAFYLGIYEVTEEEWEQVMGYNPSTFKRPRRPATCVLWRYAKEFCKRLSELPKEKEKGYSYRLPTEAEWEYACRGGNVEFSLYHFGNTITKKQANIGNKVGRTTNVGSYAPNAFGLYDMHGNVWEYCLDAPRTYQDRAETDPIGPTAMIPFPTVRGGSYLDMGYRNFAASYRQQNDGHLYSHGFRVVCEVKP